MSARDLQMRYRRLAEFEPYNILLQLNRLEDEPKIKALLEVARELQTGGKDSCD